VLNVADLVVLQNCDLKAILHLDIRVARLFRIASVVSPLFLWDCMLLVWVINLVALMVAFVWREKALRSLVLACETHACTRLLYIRLSCYLAESTASTMRAVHRRALYINRPSSSLLVCVASLGGLIFIIYWVAPAVTAIKVAASVSELLVVLDNVAHRLIYVGLT